MDSSGVTIPQIVFSLTNPDSKFPNANSDDSSAFIYTVQVTGSVPKGRVASKMYKLIRKCYNE